MPLSWNEIRDRAQTFATRWKDADSEQAQSQHFWVEFFHIFDVDSKRVSMFEKRVNLSHPNASLADLYDPLTMPPNLVKAHKMLDAAVDAAYGKKGFKSDAERVAFLFELYRKYTSLLPAEPTKLSRRRVTPK